MNNSTADLSAVQQTSSNAGSGGWNNDQPQMSNTANLTAAPTFGSAPATTSSSDGFPVLSSAPSNWSQTTNTTISTSTMINNTTPLPVASTSILPLSMTASPLASTPLPQPFSSVNSQNHPDASLPIDNPQPNTMPQQPGVIIGVACSLLGLSCVMFGLAYHVLQRRRNMRKALRTRRTVSGFDFNGGSEGDYDGGYDVWDKVSVPNTPAHFGAVQPACIIKGEKADFVYDGPHTLMNNISRHSAATVYSTTDDDHNDTNNSQHHYQHHDDGPIYSAPSKPPSAYGSYNEKVIAI